MFYVLMALVLTSCAGETSTKVETLEEDVSSYTAQLEEVQEKITQLESITTALQEENLQLTQKNEQYEQSIETLQQELSQRPTIEELETWILEKDYLNTQEISDLITTIAPTLTEFSMLLDQIETNAEDIANHHTDITNLQNNVSANADSIASHDTEITNMQDDITVNSTALDTLEDDVTTLTDSTGNGVEAGTIVIWSGTITDIPVDWALCDGNNGTPDLRDRFVIGAGNSYSIDQTGGSSSGSVSYSTSSATLGTCNAYACGSFSYVTGVSGSSAIPPYYALAFIMKL